MPSPNVVRPRLLAAVLSACLLLPVTTSTASSAARLPLFASQSADAIVAAARAAMTAAGSVTGRGGAPINVPRFGKVTVSETNYTGTASGSQVVKLTYATPYGGPALPSTSVLVVDGALYVDQNAAAWSSSLALSNAESARLANKWVYVPSSSALYAPASADLTMSSLTKNLFNAQQFHKGSIRKIDGVDVVGITYLNTGPDAGPAICYIALGGKHLPVLATIGGIPLHLGSWGIVKELAAPQGAVPLPSLLPSSSSG